MTQTYSITEQIKRAMNGGHWMATGETEQIYHHNEIVGFKRIFVFYEGQVPTVKEASWVMFKFSVNSSLVVDDEPNVRSVQRKGIIDECPVRELAASDYLSPLLCC
ncbi:NAC domain-containing protein 59-like [Durio zibethinus]|uniref:NAC domain-containing protein 59-like n=1 Tax=Durio zibethinus TaxID=66656 RepID=A0A6P5WU02_DURZI|nr:NAC domain-containing protein 59-like [Durio zibethinus]